jgi:hypothetical protein
MGQQVRVNVIDNLKHKRDHINAAVGSQSIARALGRCRRAMYICIDISAPTSRYICSPPAPAKPFALCSHQISPVNKSARVQIRAIRYVLQLISIPAFELELEVAIAAVAAPY